MEKKLLIIDADSIIYYIAYNFRNKKVKKMVELSVNKFISDLLTTSGAQDYIGFYGSKEDDAKPNFRYDIYPEYKSNRPDTPEFVKKWRPLIHSVFKDKWKFLPIDGMEADDAVGITYTYYKDAYDEIIIATADKDLKQFACTFYDFNKHEITKIDSFAAAHSRYYQMIMGDAGDHIPGIPGIGKVGAKKLLAECKTERQLQIATARAYYTYWNKQKRNIVNRVIADYTEGLDEEATDTLAKLSEAKRNRAIRIATKQQIADKLEEISLTSWKTYFILQCRLVSMLTEAPSFFPKPDPIASPFGDLEITTTKPLTSAERKAALSSADDFLII